MKREVKKFVLLLFAVAVLSTPMLFAQDPSPPTGWGDVIMNPQKWFVDFGAYTLLIAFVATFVNGVLKIVKRWPRQLVAWGVAIVLLVVTDLLNFGYAANSPYCWPVYTALQQGWRQMGRITYHG
jgi:hypothetical protein